MKYKLLPKILALLLTALQLSAAEPVTSEADDLTMMLEDATKVVTESKLNIDYTPSVVSVLYQKELQQLGIKTLFEALSILPGVETSINQLGVKKVVIRGFDNPNNFVFDKSKLLIDGVSIETGIYGNTSYYLDLPVDVIERIEVLRGPGSALYGNGAFNGVINIITTQHEGVENALFFSGGSDEYYLGGLRHHYKLNDNTTLYSDLYYQRHNREIGLDESFDRRPVYDSEAFLTSGGTSLIPLDYTDGIKSHEELDDYSIGFALEHDAWRFQTRFKKNKNGNYFGWDEYTELSDNHENEQRYFLAELQYSDAVTSSTDLTAKVGYNYYRLEIEGQNFYKIPVPVTAIWIDYLYSFEEKEQSTYAKLFIENSSYDNHKFILGTEFKTLREISNTMYDDINSILPPASSAPEQRPLFKEGVTRNITSLYARDTITFNENLSALVAARGDYYEQQDKSYGSAQAGLIYQADEMWNFKLNYGHAYRLPSWIEQYTVEYGETDGTRQGNENLKAETTDTFEAIAIYHYHQSHHFQANIYYSIMNNVIDIQENPNDTYTNHAQRTSQGVELDYTYLTSNQNRLHLNFTYNKTSYTTPLYNIEQDMPGVAQIMAKGYYIHHLSPNISLSTLIKYIGERPRNEDWDGRSDGNYDIDPYTTVDLTLNLMEWHDLDIHASLKNAFNEDVRYTSFYTRHIEGIPREGRNFLVQGEYRF